MIPSSCTPLVAFVTMAVAVVTIQMQGCGGEAQSGPPALHLDDSICAECGMILSDARSVSATIFAGVRGDEPELFDDFNCQSTYESSNRERRIVKRWCHDYESTQWFDMRDAYLVHSEQIKTPMASNTIAFQNEADAEAVARQKNGTISKAKTIMFQE